MSKYRRKVAPILEGKDGEEVYMPPPIQAIWDRAIRKYGSEQGVIDALIAPCVPKPVKEKIPLTPEEEALQVGLRVKRLTHFTLKEVASYLGVGYPRAYLIVIKKEEIPYELFGSGGRGSPKYLAPSITTTVIGYSIWC